MIERIFIHILYQLVMSQLETSQVTKILANVAKSCKFKIKMLQKEKLLQNVTN
jgi:hypothetical protein